MCGMINQNVSLGDAGERSKRKLSRGMVQSLEMDKGEFICRQDDATAMSEANLKTAQISEQKAKKATVKVMILRINYGARGDWDRGERGEGRFYQYILIHFIYLHIPSYTFIYPKYLSYTFIYPHIPQNIQY